MKRREFLTKSASLAGAMIPAVGLAETPKPCPPVKLDATGGKSGVGSCAVDEIADWVARSTGPGVVWSHNFEHENEVLNFLMFDAVNDADGTRQAQRGYKADVRWNATDGLAGGGCLEMFVPAADEAFIRDPTGPWRQGGWKRPFSPLLCDNGDPRRGNGKGTTDPGANGTIEPKEWRPWYNEAGPSAWNTTARFKHGYYAHPDYWNNPAYPGQAQGWTFDGTEYYLQFRLKIPQERFVPTRILQPGNVFFTNKSPILARNHVTKVIWLGERTNSSCEHQIIAQAGERWNYSLNRAGAYKTHRFRMYSRGVGNLNIGNRLQPGGDWDATCTVTSDNAAPNACWEYAADAWNTFLVYVKPGTDRVNNTTIRVWVAENGRYRPIVDYDKWALHYQGSTDPLGYNCTAPTNYDNGPENSVDMAAYRDPTSNLAIQQTFSHKFTQIIFSRQFIPAPQV